MSYTHDVDDVQSRGGEGWVAFAGTMVAIVGVLNIIYGIAAISDSKFYFASDTYVIHDLHAYGWTLLLIGIVQFAALIGLSSMSSWARWVCIATAGLNAIVQMLWIATYPFAAIAMLSIDLLIIYGLIAHWHKRDAV